MCGEPGLPGKGGFAAGTPVALADGTTRAVETLQGGEAVRLADGGVGTVLRVHGGPADAVVTLRSLGGRGFTCTSAQRVAAVRRTAVGWKDGGPRLRVDRDASGWAPEWLAAGNLAKGDFVPVPVPKVVEHRRLVWEGHPLELDADLGWLVGMFLAEGSFVKLKPRVQNRASAPGENVGIQFSLHRDEVMEATRIQALLRDRFWVETRRWTRLKPKTASIRTRQNREVVRFFAWACGEYAGGKRLRAELFAAHEPFIRGVVEGFWTGDGCLTTGKAHYADTWQVKTVSRDLADQLVAMLLRLRVAPFTFAARGGGGKAKKMVYAVSVFGRDIERLVEGWTSHRRYVASKARWGSGVLWLPILSVDRQPSTGPVYDLTVAGSTYAAGGLGVHGCGPAVGCRSGRAAVLRSSRTEARREQLVLMMG